MIVLQLSPTVPLDTDKGPGHAHFLLDMGQEHHTMFGVFIDATGQFWWIQGREVRLQANWTMGRRANAADPLRGSLPEFWTEQVRDIQENFK